MKLPFTRILPQQGTTAKLFLTGATVGPIVDSLHNQCLLTYGIAPITLESTPGHPIFCSSWLIPPLLGIAYVVLGGILPRLASTLLPDQINSWRLRNSVASTEKLFNSVDPPNRNPRTKDTPSSTSVDDASVGMSMKNKAILAVASTALIIRLSEFLQTQNSDVSMFANSAMLLGSESESSAINLAVMAAASLSQWLLLDGTPAALIAALVTSIGGPLSELPFVAAGCWHYIPQAADYLPLSGLSDGAREFASRFLGEDCSNLALSSITGPCYFAVTMDAVALGRWFDSMEENES